MTAALEFHGVHKSFGANRALVDAFFVAERGEVHALLGNRVHRPWRHKRRLSGLRGHVRDHIRRADWFISYQHVVQHSEAGEVVA